MHSGTTRATAVLASIPVIDLAPLRAGSSDGAHRMAELIGRACRDVGVFYVVNHGIPETTVSDLFHEAARFFALPREEKMAIHMKKSPHHRGYFDLYERKTASATAGDLKEGLDFGLDLEAEDPGVRTGNPLLGPNVWPARQPTLKPAVEVYYVANVWLARELLRALAMSLGLKPRYFDDRSSQPLARLKVLHYPAQPPATDGELQGCGPHTDYGCLTILAQDRVSGLELLDRAGAWVRVDPMPGALFINLGDQMARWTNDVFRATPHRVVNRSGRKRYSIAFFFHPSFDTVISCLEPCQGPDNPPKYPPITVGAHLLEAFNSPTSAYRR